jgi:hypothetical protein
MTAAPFAELKGRVRRRLTESGAVASPARVVAEVHADPGAELLVSCA